MIKFAFFVLFVSLSCLVSSCHSSSVNTFENAAQQAQVTKVSDKRVITDSKLGKNLVITEIRETITNDGYKRVQAIFKNTESKSIVFLYHFTWTDDQGTVMECQEGSQWIQKFVLAGDDIVLTSVAPLRNCHDFKLHLKYLK